MTDRARWTMMVTVGTTALVLIAAGVTRNPWLFLIAGIGAASAALIWGPRMPLK